MKSQKIVGLLGMILFFSCSPTIHYLGESYPETIQLDVYYDEADVEQEYTTIGKMTHDNYLDFEVNNIKNSMIRKAKEKGGDGIIFLELTKTGEEDIFDDRILMTAKIIKYKKKV